MNIQTNNYVPLWNKYRPAILQFMRASSTETQQYKLSAHEFRAVGLKVKPAFTFNTSANNYIGTSDIARDLLFMLQQSKTGNLLLSEATYEFRMDNDFVLHITKKSGENNAN